MKVKAQQLRFLNKNPRSLFTARVFLYRPVLVQFYGLAASISR
jgi:hypothetical protein